MWSISYDNLFVGAVMIVLVGALVSQVVVRANVASLLEARRLAKCDADHEQHSGRRPVSRRRWLASNSNIRCTTISRVPRERPSRKVNPR